MIRPRLRPLRPLSLLAAAALVAASPLHAQPAQDLSGAWQMDMAADLPAEELPELRVAQPLEAADCVYAGDCQMQQSGNDLTGTVELTLVSGPEDCPPEMTATLDGNVDGSEVFGTLKGPQGTAGFSGAEDNSFSGTFEATEGPFAGSTGEWLAERSILAIPALTGTGLTVLLLALLAAGAWMLRRERRPA